MEIITSQQNGFNFVHNMIYLSEVDQPLGNSTLLIQALAAKYGVYYSSLLQLEYFDAVRFTAIDPMHNLFLGTAKHQFKLWVKNNFLTKKDRSKDFRRTHSLVRCWNRDWTIAPQDCFELWWLHCFTMEELDINLFYVWVKGSVTRKSFKMLANICSCLPVSLFSCYVQD